jgi:hypothetical protein
MYKLGRNAVVKIRSIQLPGISWIRVIGEYKDMIVYASAIGHPRKKALFAAGVFRRITYRFQIEGRIRINRVGRFLHMKQYAVLLVHIRNAVVWDKPQQLLLYRIRKRHDNGETVLALINSRVVIESVFPGDHSGMAFSSRGEVVWEILDTKTRDTNSQFILWTEFDVSKKLSTFSISHPRGISVTVTEILWGSESVLNIIFSDKYIFKLNIEKVRRCELAHIRLTWEDLISFNENPPMDQRFAIDNHGNLIQFIIRDLAHFDCLNQITMIKILLSRNISFVRF